MKKKNRNDDKGEAVAEEAATVTEERLQKDGRNEPPTPWRHLRAGRDRRKRKRNKKRGSGRHRSALVRS